MYGAGWISSTIDYAFFLSRLISSTADLLSLFIRHNLGNAHINGAATQTEKMTFEILNEANFYFFGYVSLFFSLSLSNSLILFSSPFLKSRYHSPPLPA